MACEFQELGRIFQKTGQRNPNFRVAEESIGLAQQRHGRQSTFFQSHLDALAGISFREIAQRQGPRLLVGGQDEEAEGGGGLGKLAALHAVSPEMLMNERRGAM
ncbi:hypothetical protein D9M68_869230 [compost metagenome]